MGGGCLYNWCKMVATVCLVLVLNGGYSMPGVQLVLNGGYSMPGVQLVLNGGYSMPDV